MEKMEKNKSLRLALGLFILVLLTICVVATTFAKYTTTGSANDTARVAKWGVTAEVSDSNLFGANYKNSTDTDENEIIATASSDAAVSAAKNGDNQEDVVAPGTENAQGLTTTISGTSEVEVQVGTTATLELTGWEIDPDGDGTEEEYCPIVITIDGTAYKMGATADQANHVYDTIADFKEAVEKALKTPAPQTFPPNTNLGSDNGVRGFEHKVTWAWPFEDTNAGSYQTDAKDTALGNLENAPKIGLKYTVTVTQVD